MVTVCSINITIWPTLGSLNHTNHTIWLYIFFHFLFFFNYALKIWNSLPKAVRDLSSVNIFRQLKTFSTADLFHSSFALFHSFILYIFICFIVLMPFFVFNLSFTNYFVYSFVCLFCRSICNCFLVLAFNCKALWATIPVRKVLNKSSYY